MINNKYKKACRYNGLKLYLQAFFMNFISESTIDKPGN